jgi:hypothetical protein
MVITQDTQPPYKKTPMTKQLWLYGTQESRSKDAWINPETGAESS